MKFRTPGADWPPMNLPAPRLALLAVRFALAAPIHFQNESDIHRSYAVEGNL